MGYLIVDFGTSSCRAVFVDRDGICAHEERVAVTVKRKGVRAEIDADDAWKAVSRVLKILTARVSETDIDAVGISSLLGYLYLDAADQPLGPAAIWMDFRAEQEAQQMREDFPEDLIHRTAGRRMSPELLAPRLRWMKNNEGELFGRIRKVIGLKDELVRRMTGVIATDYSHMNYSLLYDYRTRESATDFVEWAGFRNTPMPEALPAQQVVGKVNRNAAVLTGLPEGVPVICGTTDGTAAMYGGGVLLPDTAVLVSGTTDVLMTLSKKPLQGSGSVLSINTGMIERTYAVGGAMGLAGGGLQRFSELLGVPVGDLIRQSEKVPPGAEGLLLLPGFSGERSPYWKSYMTGGMVGLTLNHNPGHITRALFESTSFRVRKLLEVLAAEGLSPDTLNIVGGGSSIEQWNQTRADICGVPVTVPREREATVLGTALFCRLGIDAQADPVEISRRWVSPHRQYQQREKTKERYERLFTVFEQFLSDSDATFRELSRITGWNDDE